MITRCISIHDNRLHLPAFLSQMALALKWQNSLLCYNTDEDNLRQILQFRLEDNDVLKRWLREPSNNYTSAEIQKEILNIKENCPHCSTPLLLAICIHYVDHDLAPHADVIHLYEVCWTAGKDLAQVDRDVLLRLSCLQGQTYDGAANRSGEIQGVQAVLREKQPLAFYVHCCPHCVNIVTRTVCG